MLLTVAGHSDVDIARQLLIHRNTLRNWRRSNPAYRAALDRGFEALWERTVRSLHEAFALCHCTPVPKSSLARAFRLAAEACSSGLTEHDIDTAEPDHLEHLMLGTLSEEDALSSPGILIPNAPAGRYTWGE